VRERSAPGEKVLFWIGASKRDLLGFPAAVVHEIGNALSAAQFGGAHPAVNAWKGEGPGVLEIVEDFARGTYRAVYTARFRQVIYVLHCFQKKSPSGVRTAKQDVELIRRRLKDAYADYEKRYGTSAT
jgi:phage-related protein